MKIKTNTKKSRIFFGQNVFCTDDVKVYILDLVEKHCFFKVTEFPEYLSIFNDIVFPVLVQKKSENHLLITDSSIPAITKEIAFYPSPNGGTISWFYTDEFGSKIEKNFSIETNALLYMSKATNNISIRIGYTDGIDSSIYTIAKSVDPLTNTSNICVEASLDDSILLENLEYDFLEEILVAFKNNKFVVRSSSLDFVDVFNNFSDNFTVTINVSGESIKFSNFFDTGVKLSAKLFNTDYAICISINPKTNLVDLKNLYASFLSTNFGIIN